MKQYHIGDAASAVGMSVDTLRYYERIDVLPRVARTPSGVRVYDDGDISRLQFIRKAQLMNFSLEEIKSLLGFRKSPNRSKKDVRELATLKLAEIDARLLSLKDLREELRGLIEACPDSGQGCAIIAGIEEKPISRTVRRLGERG